METSSIYAVETKDLTKIYMPPSGIRKVLMRSPVRENILAVDSINLQVKKGEVFGLLGPNGAGKTTLIKMLTTLLRPTSGSAHLAGFDVVRQEDEARKVIGLVTGEERSFYWRLTGRQNLNFFAGLCNIKRREIPQKIDQVLDQVGLSQAADNMFYSYSSGMKQKLSIARALLNEPQVLFLDEPTKSVDVIAIAEIKRFIKELANGEQKRTILLATHRLEEAEELCDRIAIVNKGRIIFCGTVGELKKTLGGRDQYLVVTNGIDKAGCKGVSDKYVLSNTMIENPGGNGTIEFSFSFANGSNPLSSVLNDIIAAGGTILSCEKKERRLEEMFIDIVSGDRN